MAIKVTSKKPLSGNRRSHSCRATKHKQKVNLVKAKSENGIKIRTSAREKRTMNKLDRKAA